MRLAVTVATDKNGKWELIASPEVPANEQRAAFAGHKVPKGGKVVLFLSGSLHPRIRRDDTPPTAAAAPAPAPTPHGKAA